MIPSGGGMQGFTFQGSGLYPDGGPVGDHAPDLFDLRIGDRDASFRPIRFQVSRTSCGLSVGEPVNHDVAAGRHIHPSRPLAVARLGIGDTQRTVELAGTVSAADGVIAFGSFAVT